MQRAATLLSSSYDWGGKKACHAELGSASVCSRFRIKFGMTNELIAISDGVVA